MRLRQVHQLHPNSIREHESLTVQWRDGVLNVTYVRHDTDTPDGPMYIEEWEARCDEPRVTERRHRSANLIRGLNDMETGG